MVDLLQNISELDGATQYLEEVIIVNNNSSVSYLKLEDFIKTIKKIPVNYIVSAENLGVARGRNFAIQQGTAPVLIMLDDDAVLKNKDSLTVIDRIFNEEENQNLGILTFKVLYFQNNEPQVNAFPHKNYKAFKDRHQFETYYFAGGAHAVRRELFSKIGLYPEAFFYGMEEYDFSYRAIGLQYKILFDDRVVMLHKESPLGRKPKAEKARMMWVNKSTVAYKYLPNKYFLSTSFLWSLFYLKNSGCNLAGFFKTYRNEIFSIKSTTAKRKLSRERIGYLKSLKARLWY
jgi:GT2 family glycosyltransferase